MPNNLVAIKRALSIDIIVIESERSKSEDFPGGNCHIFTASLKRPVGPRRTTYSGFAHASVTKPRVPSTISEAQPNIGSSARHLIYINVNAARTFRKY